MKKNSPHQNKEPKVSSLPARSKQALRETLLGLLRVKNFQSISVSELVEKSGYSRSTFYSHFRDKSDLLFSDHRLDLKNPDPIQEIFLHARENQSVFCSLTRDGLSDLLESHFLEALSGLDWLPEDPQRARFLASGLYGVLRGWLQDGCPEPVPGLADLRRWRA